MIRLILTLAACSLLLSQTAMAYDYRCSTYQGDERGSSFRYLESFNLDLNSGRPVNRYVASDLMASCTGRASTGTDGREIACGFIRLGNNGQLVVAQAIAGDATPSLTTDALHSDNYRYRIYCVH